MNPDDLNDRVALLLGRAIIRAEALTVERDRLAARLAEHELEREQPERERVG